MVYNEATSSYEKVYTNVPAGTYECKVAYEHDWAASWGKDGTSTNASVKVDMAGSTVTISFKPGENKPTATVGPLYCAGCQDGDL